MTNQEDEGDIFTDIDTDDLNYTRSIYYYIVQEMLLNSDDFMLEDRLIKLARQCLTATEIWVQMEKRLRSIEE